MRPQKRQYTLQMPLTFENRDNYKIIGKDQFFLAGIILLVWFVASLVMVVKGYGSNRVKYPLLLLVLAITVIRLIIMRERHYLKKRRELEAQDYMFDHNMFWDIYEISDAYPYICRYVSGLKAIYVVFEKDVIVGRQADNDYYHAEAIADAYLQMVKRNITCIHIDYMDSVGKDTRMEGLFEMAANTENEELRGLMTVVFDNVQQQMHKTYDSYDVYCFYYSGADGLFWDELRDVIEYFLRANYLNARILNAQGVGDLAQTLANLKTFSVSNATSRLFVKGNTEYITPIWVKRGVEKTVLNQTLAEKKEALRIAEQEREVMKKRKKFARSRRGKLLGKIRQEEEIDLYGVGEQEESASSVGEYEEEENKSREYVELEKEAVEGSAKVTEHDIIEIDDETNLWDM